MSQVQADTAVEVISTRPRLLSFNCNYPGELLGSAVYHDTTSKHFYPRAWANKLAAGFTCSFYPSGDKLHTLQPFVTLAMQHGMLWTGAIVWEW